MFRFIIQTKVIINVAHKQLTLLSLKQAGELVRSKKVSPVEIVQETIEVADEKNKSINFYISKFADRALEQAKKAESEILNGNYKGIMHGMPVSVKDIINIKNEPTTCASGININNIAKENAEIINNLEDSGAIIIGKENMHSLAYGSTGDVSYFGAVKNPLNTTRIAGGSSAGSAASVASNASFASVGSDTGGSIRIPAACCGVVGMKPSFGLVSRSGTVSLSSTLDTLGPITKNVEDNFTMLNAMLSKNQKLGESTVFKSSDIFQKNYTIGVPRNYTNEIIDDDIAEKYEETIAALKSSGFKIKHIDLPFMQEFDAAQSVIFAAEVYESLEKAIFETPEKIEMEVRNRLLEGLFIKAEDYIKMQRVRHLAIETYKTLFSGIDVILTPSLCVFPGRIGEREIELNGKPVNIRNVYSRLFKVSNLTGFPALSVPRKSVFTNGFLHSYQLIGLPYDEKTLYEIAYILEQI